MADNIVLNAGSGGATLAMASLTFSGDTAAVQIVGCSILSGSEGAWTLSQLVGGAGAVTAGVQRVTLASDDPAVVDLAAIETLITAGNVDLAALEVLVTAGNVDLAAIEVLLTTIDADTSRIPALGQAAMAASTPVVVASDQTAVPVSGTFWQATQPVSGTFWQTTQPVSLASVPSHAVTNVGTFVVQVDGSALTALQLLDDAIHVEAGALSKGVLIVLDDGTDAQFAQANASGHLKVDISTDSVGIGGGTQYAVDAALGATPTGTLALAIRDDALSALTPVEGDAIGLRVDANGALWVIPSGTVAVSGTFWQATQPVSGTVTVGSITAGDNNIGNIDIVTLPAGNLGMQAMAASLSVVPASDITDATYIGDIKFGESVPAGTAIIGKIGIDQTTPGTTNAVAVKDGTGIAITSTQVGASWTALDVYVANEDEDPLVVRSIEESSWMYVGNKLRPVGKFNKVVNSIGDNVLVAAVAGRRIRLLSIALFGTSATATNVYLRDGADTNVFGDANGVIPIAVDADGDNSAGFVLLHNRHGWGNDTQLGQSLDINLSAAQYVIVVGAYVEVD